MQLVSKDKIKTTHTRTLTMPDGGTIQTSNGGSHNKLPNKEDLGQTPLVFIPSRMHPNNPNNLRHHLIQVRLWKVIKLCNY